MAARWRDFSGRGGGVAAQPASIGAMSTPDATEHQALVRAAQSALAASPARTLAFAHGGERYVAKREAQATRIFIGSENNLFSLSGSAVIAAPYRDAGGQIVGVVGVIGPTRLNYARIVPMVDFTAQALSRLMT